jgi:hypothetical protein
MIWSIWHSVYVEVPHAYTAEEVDVPVWVPDLEMPSSTKNDKVPTHRLYLIWSPTLSLFLGGEAGEGNGQRFSSRRGEC